LKYGSSHSSKKQLICRYSKNKEPTGKFVTTLCHNTNCVAVRVYKYINNSWVEEEELFGCQSRHSCSEAVKCNMNIIKKTKNHDQVERKRYLYCCCGRNMCNEVIEKDPHNLREVEFIKDNSKNI